jgi:hypothetical protein
MTNLDHKLADGRLVILRLIDARTYEESAAAFEKLQADILVEASEWEALETKRLIANDLFDLALRHERPFSEWNRLFEQLRELGFSDLGTKVSAYYGYVEECLLLGNDALAAGYAWEIVAELSSGGRSAKRCRSRIGSRASACLRALLIGRDETSGELVVECKTNML